MKVLKIAQLAREPQVNPLFTGPVTMQSIVDTDLSNHFLIRQVNFGLGVRIIIEPSRNGTVTFKVSVNAEG